MTEDNLVIEHLRHIRGRVDQIAEDVTDLKQRMTSLERAMSLVKPASASASVLTWAREGGTSQNAGRSSSKSAKRLP